MLTACAQKQVQKTTATQSESVVELIEEEPSQQPLPIEEPVEEVTQTNTISKEELDRLKSDIEEMQVEDLGGLSE